MKMIIILVLIAIAATIYVYKKRKAASKNKVIKGNGYTSPLDGKDTIDEEEMKKNRGKKINKKIK